MDKKIKTKKKILSFQVITIDKILLTPLLIRIRIKSLRKEKQRNKKLRKAQERK